MPVEFLTADQIRRYGRYGGEPNRAQLDRYFLLDDADRKLVREHRGDHNRLGFALQLGTVRFLGTFLSDPADVPTVVVDYLVPQIGVGDASCLKHYAARRPTQHEHAREIRERYGYQDFSDADAQEELVAWLKARAWSSAERPSVLFDRATAWLIDAKVLLPGPTVLARLVASIRERAAEGLFRTLAALPSPQQRSRLERLLETEEPSRVSKLDRLRRAPTKLSATGLVRALERVEEIRRLGVSELDLSAVPPTRVVALGRYASTAKAQAIARMAPERRLATLLAVARRLEIAATDDALDVFDQLLAQQLSRAKRESDAERLAILPRLGAAASVLSAAVEVLLEPPAPTLDAIWAAISRCCSREDLTAAHATVSELSLAAGDRYHERALRQELMARYPSVRRFLPTLLEAIRFQSAEGGRPVLAALEVLRRLEGRKKVMVDEVPQELVTGAWRRLVFHNPDLPTGELDRRAYTFCVLEQLRNALRRRDVFVARSERWVDPRARLLAGAAWEAAREGICRSLHLERDPRRHLAAMAAQLDDAYRMVAERLPTNTALTVQREGGRDRPHLASLEKLEEPLSLTRLADCVACMLPRVDLPELLLEVAAWTGYPDEFTHITESGARVDDLATSVCAVLLAEACNIGFAPLVKPSIAALTRARLSWVDQNYVRAETIIRANARLVRAQTDIPLAWAWGGGEVASADGMRFVVPVRTIHAGPNPRYFGPGRGVTWLNFLSDQVTGFNAIVPGTVRDSLYTLGGLLEQETTLRPTTIVTDTASYTDQAFGLYRLVGFQFSPDLADLPDQRFWRIDRDANYGPLDGIARNRINTELIAANWDDLLRLAGSLVTGAVRATEIMRLLQGGGRPTTLGRALAEFGRIPKTLHMLALLDDEDYRRQIHGQRNLHEERHSLARKVFHGQRGELRQRYREGQEDQLGALGLVLNAIVLWNTRYMNKALDQLRAEGYDVRDEDIARLSPLGYKHIHMHGRYHFRLSKRVRGGRLRPLRDPSILESEGAD
jgi:TnpA family transposase